MLVSILLVLFLLILSMCAILILWFGSSFIFYIRAHLGVSLYCSQSRIKSTFTFSMPRRANSFLARMVLSNLIFFISSSHLYLLRNNFAMPWRFSRSLTSSAEVLNMCSSTNSRAHFVSLYLSQFRITKESENLSKMSEASLISDMNASSQTAIWNVLGMLNTCWDNIDSSITCCSGLVSGDVLELLTVLGLLFETLVTRAEQLPSVTKRSL